MSALGPPLPRVLMCSYGSHVVFVGRRCACPKLNPASWPWVVRADLWHPMPKSIRCGDVKATTPTSGCQNIPFQVVLYFV